MSKTVEVASVPPPAGPVLVSANTALLRWEKWSYEPKQDVTAYEASLLCAFVPSFLMVNGVNVDFGWLTRRCGDSIMRHFRREA